MACNRVCRQHDDVVGRLQTAFLELGVHQRLERHVELLEHQPRPALVHVAAAVTLIHCDPRLANLVRARGQGAGDRGEVHARLFRDLSEHRGTGSTRGTRHDEIARSKTCSIRHTPNRHTLVEKQVHRAIAVIELG